MNALDFNLVSLSTENDDFEITFKSIIYYLIIRMSAPSVKDIFVLVLIVSLFGSIAFMQPSSVNVVVAASYQSASLSPLILSKYGVINFGGQEQQQQQLFTTVLEDLATMSINTDNNATVHADSNTDISNTAISTTGNLRNDIQNCSTEEVALYVHGWAPINKRKVTEEQNERVDLAIKHNRYPRNIAVQLFSWDSEVVDWQQAKANVDTEGDKLANWILTFKENCPNDNVRIIAHSLGSRVVLSALNSLENNTRWKQGGFNITSVHLMGAAADDEKISKNQSDIDHSPSDDGKVYGNAIERNVVMFYNLYNPHDDILERVDPGEQREDNQPEVYPSFEQDDALGSRGIQQAAIDEVNIPSNYEEKDVQNEIPPINDADAGAIIEAPLPECDVTSYIPPFNCTISANRSGDNHLGYMGFRDPTNSSRLIADGGEGAMDVVVSDWLRN